MATTVITEAPVVTEATQVAPPVTKKPRSDLQRAQLEQARVKAMAMRKERAALKKPPRAAQSKETPPLPAEEPAKETAEEPPPAEPEPEPEIQYVKKEKKPKKTK